MKFLLVLSLLLAVPAFGEIYVWKDAAGTSHYTNLPDTIPPRYRGKAKVLAIPGERKNEQAPAAQGQPQAAPTPSALPMPPPAPTQPATPVPRQDRKSRRVADE